MSEWTPAELDAIEDALESLEDDRPITAEPRVLARLADYRNVLRWSREALLTEEPPRHVLEVVLREAREAAVHDAADPAYVRPEAGPARSPGWWKRITTFVVIPGFAVAGTAALVLVLARTPSGAGGDTVLAEAPAVPAAAESAPTFDGRLADASLEQKHTDEDANALRARAEDPERGAAANEPPGPIGGAAERAKASALPRADAFEKTVVPGRGAGSASIRGDAEGPPRPLAPAKPAAEAKLELPAEETRSAATPVVLPKKDPVPEAPSKPATKPKPSPPSASQPADAKQKAEPEPAQPDFEPQAPAETERDDDEAREQSLLDGADRQRRAGRCSDARPVYRRLQDARDAHVRARAWAGLGLCEEQAGNASAAKGHYTKAAALDPAVQAFILREQADEASKAQSAVPRK